MEPITHAERQEPQDTPDILSPDDDFAAAPERDDRAEPERHQTDLPEQAGDLPTLDDPTLYLNRELSWLAFNDRVMGEVLDASYPLLERVKFLSIFHSNLDEWYMVRVSGFQQQAAAGLTEVTPDGMTPAQQLALIRAHVEPALAAAGAFFHTDLMPALAGEGIRILDYAQLSRGQKKALRSYFQSDIFPVLTPLAFGPGHPFPHISNLSLNLAVVIQDAQLGERFARMKVPGVLPRLVPCPPATKHISRDADDGAEHSASHADEAQCFVWLEQVIAANVDTLFPGLQVSESYCFRVTRDADLEIREDEASDLLEMVEESLRQRHFGDVCRLEISADMPARLRDLLIENILVNPSDVYALNGPLGLSDVMQLLKLDRPDLKDPPFIPAVPPELAEPNRSLLDVIGTQDMILHHPYDSFAPIIEFIRTGSRDSGVLAMKQTLYRVGSNSPIVKLLAEARDDDTQVAVLVELKARFDEENNIEWARALEDAGVHVVYGLIGLKTHCKVALVVRKDKDGGLSRYVHLGTGNYNPSTARIYTDLSFLTAQPEIGADVSDLFNLLTGYSRQKNYRKLLVAPVNMRQRLLEMIAREAAHAREGKHARLILKTNTLSDEPIIRALYDAAQAGVQIDLIVRGVCCLRPGVPGVSENIRVTSVIGRFLEHSRMYYFHNGSRPQLYLGSADLMRRNLDRRVEVLFPIESPTLKKQMRDNVLEVYLRDTVRAHRLLPTGRYERVVPAAGQAPFSAQQHFLDERAGSPEPAPIRPQ